MKSGSAARLLGGFATTVLLALSAVALVSSPAGADTPDPQVVAPFQAPTCAGETAADPTQNTGYAVEDLTSVFGERLTAYNAGAIVPLYDAYGGSVLLTSDGTNTEQAAYPPVCGTRYVASLDSAVSEWMYCTDRAAQSCADTDSAGRLVDHDGNPLNPMTGLSGNARLMPEQERLIAYLVQHGHSYAGTGDQSWGGVTYARSDAGTNERAALQTLIWCISDPSTDASDFATTCEASMDEAEQARLLAMIPEDPELSLSLTGATSPLAVGDTADFEVSTNVFDQPIIVTTGGTASGDWSVCAGDATLAGTTLTVHSSGDPAAPKTIALCITATSTGSASLHLSASPPSTTHIGWAQSVGNNLPEGCQVYATFHEVDQLALTATAEASFVAAPSPTPTPTVTGSPSPTPTPTMTVTPTSAPADAGDLAATGGSDGSALLLVGLGLLGAGGLACWAGVLLSRRS